MSPAFPKRETRPPGFPRVSGDEPTITAARAIEFSFSPRERG